MLRRGHLLRRGAATAAHSVHDACDDGGDRDDGTGREDARLVTTWLTAAMMISTLVAGLWVASSVFEHTPHVEDELAYLFQAKTMAEGHVTAPSPPVDDAYFLTPFTIDDGTQWYGKYTPGYPAVLAVGVKVGAPWLVNPLAAALAVGLTVLLGIRVYGRRTGMLAGALLAMSPMALVHSGTYFSHNVALCLALGVLLAAERVWRTGSQLAGLLAGACLGMLLLTRPFAAAALAAPLAVAAIVHLWQGRHWRPMVAAAGTLAIAAGVLLMYNEHTTGRATLFGYEVYWPFDRVGFGPGHGRTVQGHSLAAGWRNTQENLRQLRHWMFGWPGATDLLPVMVGAAVSMVSLTSVVVLAVRRRRDRARNPDDGPGSEPAHDPNRDRDRGSSDSASSASSGRQSPARAFDLLLLGVALGPVIAHLAYWTPGAVHGPRYYFEGLAAMALLAARGARHVATWMGSAGLRAQVARPTVAVAFLGLSVVGLATTTLDRFDDSRGYYGVSTAGLRAVEALGLHDALVFVPAERWTDFEPYAAANSPYLDTDVVYAVDYGEFNQQLIDALPARTPYLWSDGELTPLGNSGAPDGLHEPSSSSGPSTSPPEPTGRATRSSRRSP